MAPSKRSSIRAKASRLSSSADPSATAENTPLDSTTDINPDYSYASTETSLSRTKKQKRDSKTRLLLTRLESSGITNSAGVVKSRKRRRGAAAGASELNTTLNNLADALPDVDAGNDDTNTNTDGNGVVVARTRAGNPADVNMPTKMQSLGTKRGMQKKRLIMEKRERERFGRNLAVMLGDENKFGIGRKVTPGIENGSSLSSADQEEGMAVVKSSSGGTGSAAGGLRALRAFVEGRLEVQKALG